MILDDIVNNCIQSDFLNSPIYTALGPLRHYIGGLLFRNAAEKICQKASGKKEPLSILSNPLMLYLCAASPDIDHLVGLAHRNATHSLAFAAAVGLGTSAVAALRKKGSIGAYFALPFAAVASHVGVDLLVEGGDPMNPLWPVTTERNVQIHPNYELIGHAFTALGLAYMSAYYGLSDKLRNVKQCLIKKFKS